MEIVLMAIKNEITQIGLTPKQAIATVVTVATGLTATGSTKDDATVCQGAINVFTTVAAGTGVKLGAPLPPVALGTIVAAHHLLSLLSAGDAITIVNHGANALLVYPPEGGKLNNGTANEAVSLAANATRTWTFINNINAVSP
jgi:hypothetical protein